MIATPLRRCPPHRRSWRKRHRGAANSPQLVLFVVFAGLFFVLAGGDGTVDASEAATDTVPPETVILTTYLSSFINVHHGTRNVYLPAPTAHDALRALKPLLESVEAIEEPGVSLVVLTDIAGLDGLESGRFRPRFVEDIDMYRSVWRNYSAHDVRWVMQSDYLSQHPAPCVFMVDASDVEVLQHPGRLCAGHLPGTLFMGTDVSGAVLGDETPTSVWLEWLIRYTRYGEVANDAQFAEVMAAGTHQAANCGIVGGDAATVGKYLRNAIGIMWQRRHLPLTKPVDMLIANHLAWVTFAGQTVFGHPLGEVALPFRKECRLLRCDIRSLIDSGRYFFTHKAPKAEWPGKRQQRNRGKE